MSAEPDESALLIAFARAASKAQEIEHLLQETVLGAEVTEDTRNRSFEQIAKKIDKLPLGPLKQKYLETIGKDIRDPLFQMMWNEINEERIFLMHKFFRVFPIAQVGGPKEAANRLARIDQLLDIGHRILKQVLDMMFKRFNIPPVEFRKFLASVVERRKELRTSE
jgi:hypothetical protein